MKIPSRRKLGATALILAGIVAVGVPFFLLHSASPQGTSPSPTTTSGNNNGGSSTSNSHGGSPASSTCTQDCSTTGSGSNTNSGSGGSNNNSCSDDKSQGSGSDDETSDTNTSGKQNGEHNGNAFGVLKNRLDTSIALVKSMGVHNSAFHQHHDTKTDNHTVHDPESAGHDSNNDDQSCTATEDANDQD